MANFQMTITDAGLSLLAASMTGAGKGLHFTKMEMGDAAYSGNLAAVTAVVSPKCELELSHMARSGDQVTFKSVLAFREVETGFTWRELGLYAQNPDKRLANASTTKIMTALLTLEQPDQDRYFTVDSDAIQVEGTTMGLQPGDSVTMRINRDGPWRVLPRKILSRAAGLGMYNIQV